MDLSKTKGLSPDAVARAVEREFEALHFISEVQLAKHCNVEPDQLDSVQTLVITVDAGEHSVSRIGKFLPNLTNLRFNNSFLPGFRELGTSLKNLRIFWASRCGITDVDGIAALPALRELYISFNNVSDLTPLSMHDNIQVLDLEGNAVEDVDQIAQIGTCGSIATLSLLENPIAQIDHYRSVILRHIPHLEQLDDEPVSNNERQEAMDDDVYKATVGSFQACCRKENKGSAEPMNYEGSDATKEEFLVTQTLRRKGLRESDDLYKLGNRGKWATRTGRVDEEINSLKNQKRGSVSSAPSGRPSRRPSISKFVSTNDKALTAAPPSPKGLDARENLITSSSSDLTHGAEVVFAGSAVHALRRRKSEHDNSVYRGANNRGAAFGHHKGVDGRPNAPNSERDKRLSIMATLDRVMEMEDRIRDASISSKTREDVLKELAKWKLDAEVIQKRKVIRNTDASRIRPASASSRSRAAGMPRPQTARGNEHETFGDRPRSSPGHHHHELKVGPVMDSVGRRSNAEAVPGSPEWRRHRERSKHFVAMTKTPDRTTSRALKESPGSSGKKGRQPGEMVGLLVDWKQGGLAHKKTKSSKCSSPSQRHCDSDDEYPNPVGGVEEEGPSPDTLWRAERAKRRNEHEALFKSTLAESEETSTSETDMDAQIEEMNERIQQCEQWGNRVGLSSPASPRELTPTTRSGEYSNSTPSPKLSPADSDGKVDLPGLKVETDEIRASVVKKLVLGSAVTRKDEDLIELLRVKPKRVPELRTHDGFQQFFNGIEEKRMKRLLDRAFEGLEPKNKRKKIKRRMALLEGFMRK